MNAEIIGIGSELLLGQIANIDAQFISQQLSLLGIDVYYHTVVGDNRDRLLSALDSAAKRADLIITTGGLGPTMDDISKETVAEYLGLEMSLHQPSAEHIKSFFAKRNRLMPENNLKQAMFPEGAHVLPNVRGTAPGAIIEKEGRTFILLPGPPNELMPMFQEHAIPYLLQKSNHIISSRVIRIFGMGESAVEEKIKDLLIEQSNPTIAPLAGYGEVTLRITAKATKDRDADSLIEPVKEEILKRLGNVVYGFDDERLETVLVRLLRKYKKTLAVAESCSGGLICNLITNVPGSSEIFLEGCIAYSNNAKSKRLGVSRDTLLKYGAVSRQTAAEMADGIRNTAETDYGVAVTGIADSGGDMTDKPVGLIYMAIADRNGTEVQRHLLSGDRQRIKQDTANIMLNWLRLRLLEEHK